MQAVVTQGEAQFIDYFLAGWIHYMQHAYADALPYFQACIERQPHAAFVRLLRGYSHFFTQAYPEAVADFDVALTYWETGAYLVTITQLFQHEGAAREAWLTAHWRELLLSIPFIEIDVDSADKGMEDYLLAVLRQWFTNVLPANASTDTLHSGAFVGRGSARLLCDDYLGAHADLTTALDLGANGFANMWRGMTAIYLGEWQAALTDCEQATARGIDHPILHFAHGIARIETGDYATGESDLTRALEGGFGGGKAFYHRGRARAQLGDVAGASADFSAAEALGNNSAELYLQRGGTRYDSGDFAGAVADFDRAVALGSVVQPLFYLFRANALYILGEYARSADDFSQIIDAPVGNIAAARARCYVRLGELEKGAADAQRALARLPDDFLTAECLGDLALVAAEFEQAIDYYSAACQQITPAHIVLKVALLLAVAGEAEDAHMQFAEALTFAERMDLLAFHNELPFWRSRFPAAPIDWLIAQTAQQLG